MVINEIMNIWISYIRSSLHLICCKWRWNSVLFFLALSGSTRYKTSKHSAWDDSFSNLNYLGIFGAFHSNKHSGSDIGLQDDFFNVCGYRLATSWHIVGHPSFDLLTDITFWQSVVFTSLIRAVQLNVFSGVGLKPSELKPYILLAWLVANDWPCFCMIALRTSRSQRPLKVKSLRNSCTQAANRATFSGYLNSRKNIQESNAPVGEYFVKQGYA